MSAPTRRDPGSRPVRALTARMTLRGVGVLLLGAALLGLGWWWNYPGVVTIGAAFVLFAALSFVSVIRPVRVRATRDVSPLEVPRHGACAGRLRVDYPAGWLPLSLDGTDRIDATARPVTVPRLAPGRGIEVSYPIPTVRRGRLLVGPFTLHRYGLAGLAAGRTDIGDVVAVRVLPRVLPVRGLPAGARRGHVGTDERVEHGGTDLVGLREYVAGDDLRRLHWATSARTGTLMVREDADPAEAHLALLLDDRAASYPGDALEDAVEVAASLAHMAVAQGNPVRLRTVSGRLDREIAGSARQASDGSAAALLGDLADLTASDTGDGVTPLPVRDLDVVAVVTGVAADIAPLVLQASRATAGLVLVVDRNAARAITAAGAVTVLRAPTADALVAAWNEVVAS